MPSSSAIAPAAPSTPYKTTTVKTLQTLLKQAGLPTTGTKTELYDRLLEHQQASAVSKTASVVAVATATTTTTTSSSKENTPPVPFVITSATSAAPAASSTTTAQPSASSSSAATTSAPPSSTIPTNPSSNPPLLVQMAPPPPPAPADLRQLRVKFNATVETITFDCADRQAADQVASALRSLFPDKGLATAKDPEAEAAFLVDDFGELYALTPGFLAACPAPGDPCEASYTVRNSCIDADPVKPYRTELALGLTLLELAVLRLVFALCNHVLGSDLSISGCFTSLPSLGLGTALALSRPFFAFSRVGALLWLVMYALGWLVASGFSSRAHRISLQWEWPRLKAQIVDLAKLLRRNRSQLSQTASVIAPALPSRLRNVWYLVQVWAQVDLPRCILEARIKCALGVLLCCVFGTSAGASLTLLALIFVLPTHLVVDQSWRGYLGRIWYESLGLPRSLAPPVQGLGPVQGLTLAGAMDDSLKLEFLPPAPHDRLWPLGFAVDLKPGGPTLYTALPASKLTWPEWHTVALVAFVTAAGYHWGHPSLGLAYGLGQAYALGCTSRLPPPKCMVILKGLASDRELRVEVRPVDCLGRTGAPAVLPAARTRVRAVRRRVLAVYEDAAGLRASAIHLTDPGRPGAEVTDLDIVLRTLRRALCENPRGAKTDADICFSTGRLAHRVVQPSYLKALQQSQNESPWTAPLILIHPPGTRSRLGPASIYQVFPLRPLFVQGWIGLFSLLFLAHVATDSEPDALPRAVQTLCQMVLLGNLTGCAWDQVKSFLGLDWALAKAKHAVRVVVGADRLHRVVLDLTPPGAPRWAQGVVIGLLLLAWIVQGYYLVGLAAGLLVWAVGGGVAAMVAWDVSRT